MTRRMVGTIGARALFCAAVLMSSRAWASYSAVEPGQSTADTENFEPGATSITRPNSLFFEIGGRAGAYSINYDRSFGDSASLGVGLEYGAVRLSAMNASAVAIPLYANLYLAPNHHRAYLTGGVTFVNASLGADQQALASSSGGATPGPHSGDLAGLSLAMPVPVFGLGYEYRGNGGFLFRVSPYLALTPWGAFPWLGSSFGATF